MTTSTPSPTPPLADQIAPDVMADMQAVADAVAAGRPLDPNLVRRVRERADRVREEIFRRHGVLEIGVPAIRALRDGTDE